jgi:hypothetical protein
MIKSKLNTILFNLILFSVALLISLLFSKASLSSDSTLSWYLGTKKSELWALSQQFQQMSVQESIGLNMWQLAQAHDFSVEKTKIEKITQNADESIPYDFPIAWYDSIENLETPTKVAREGMNLLIPYIGESSIEEVRNYLDKAEAAGIKVLVEIPRFWIRKGFTDKITIFVQKLKNHPATFGWYLYDEPEYIQLSPQLLEKAYRAIKLEDPTHSITMALNRLMHTKKYLNALDVLMYFNYPCFYDTPEFSGFEKGVFKDLAKNASSMAEDRHRFWFVLQGYGEDKYGKPTRFNRRLPTLAEERYMIYSAILAKANGLLFWSHYLTQQKWIDSVLTPILQEFKSYLPAITNQTLDRDLDKTIVANHPDLQASLYQNPETKDLLLIAINHSNHPVKTAIAFSEKINTDSVQVLTENRSITLDGKMLNDSFPPYAVHIYQVVKWRSGD